MGQPDFEDYYSTLFGNRWPALRTALLAEGAAVAFTEKLDRPYYLDLASIAAACALDLDGVPPAGLVLDACAAPGGKSLILAGRLAGCAATATLLANELSSDRRRRLSLVLDAHLPADLRVRVRVSGFDAAAAGGRHSEHGRFSAILLDAPCSSERHVLADAQALARWTPARIKNLARRQWALLSSAYLLLAAGGSLVYSTCALSPDENDRVVERLLKKHGQSIQPTPLPLDISTALASGGLQSDYFSPENRRPIRALATDYGVMYTPDVSGGAGPLYIAALRKA